MLVKHGANVNVADLWKFTPLHEAAAKGKYDIVRLLLQVIYLTLFVGGSTVIKKCISYLTTPGC